MYRTDVPCNGCTLCCQRDLIRLEAEDDVSTYITEPHPLVPHAFMLAHKPDGSCIYLSATGCTIHERAPFQCRIADCRGIARRLSFDEALLLHAAARLDIRVWDRGTMLLE